MIERCYGINTVENAIRLECGMDPIVEPDRAAEGQVWGCIGIYPNGERVRIDRRSLANLGITDHFESPAYGDRNGNPRHCTDYTDLYVLTAPDEASFNANVEALRELYEVRAQ